jgi:NitT/TauT family transport system permease protein
MAMDAPPDTPQGWLAWARDLPRRTPTESLAALLLLLVAWVIVARLTPPYILPELVVVLGDVWQILTTPDQLENVLTTLARIGLGLVSAFVIGTAIGLAMGHSRRTDRFSMPLLQMTQGVPSVSWVVIAIIWFTSVEVRIWFILLVVTMPGFTFQALDSYRAVPRELRDMAKSLRPRRFDMFRTVTLPSIVPDLLTAWKVNLGLGTRVVLVAELVGAPVGVGYQLRYSQQMFTMSGVLAWTGVLVLFVLLVQHLITRIERHLLRYRPSGVGDGADDESSRTPAPSHREGPGAP